MKILVCQAKQGKDIDVLKSLIRHTCDFVLFPEGYVHGKTILDEVCRLAKEHHKVIVTSYLSSDDGKDRAILINEYGDLVFDRQKSEINGPFLHPSLGLVSSKKVGYMLCCELFLDYQSLKDAEIIFNPIGVGMFSEDQFSEWSNRAKTIAKECNSYLIGCSHADGSYRNCGFSIPIAYVFDKKGQQIYLSKGDTRSFIIDLETHNISYIDSH